MKDNEVDCNANVLRRFTSRMWGVTAHMTEYSTLNVEQFITCTPISLNPREGYISRTTVEGVSVVFSKVKLPDDWEQYELSFRGRTVEVSERIVAQFEEYLGRKFGSENFNMISQPNETIKGVVWKVNPTQL